MQPDFLRVPIGPDRSLHVERYGLGSQPVVFLHGFGTSSFYWREIAPRLVDLPMTVFAIDLLGFGESDRPSDARFDTPAQAEALEIAFTELRLTRAAIVGNDFGGSAALQFAATRPERVEAITLINTVIEKSLDRGALRDVRLATARYAIRLARSVTGAAGLLREYLESAVADHTRMPDRLVARYLAPYVGREGADHLIALARTIAEEDFDVDAAVAVKVPLLYVWGEQDPALDFMAVERMVARFPRAELRRFPDAGRLVAEDCPGLLVTVIAEHLEGIRRM